MADSARDGARLVQVDALRGLAALSVVLFHYTTRFYELFEPATRARLQFAHGHYGVNLFFIISGFVIYMTLDRTKRPMDFVVSRFSRLFPSYWAAIALTFAITHLLGLPHKLVEWPTALANLVMVHGLFGVPHVDGVYWTLEIELLFYAGMFALHRLGWLERIDRPLLALLALGALYGVVLAATGQASLPWRVYHMLILRYLPWFALGIAIYLWLHPRDAGTRRQAARLGAAALATLALVEGAALLLLTAGMAALVFLAAGNRLALLRTRPLVWLGGISYPLYLLHENIGWSLLLRLDAAGLDANVAAPLTLAAALLLSDALHRAVELPAMKRLRAAWRRRAAA